MTLQQLLGVDVPIVQAPMAGAQGSALAVAVSNAGGLGSLPCAMLTPEAMRSELAVITAHTAQPFNVNFFCHTPPAPSRERERLWRAALAPYYEELGIEAGQVPAVPARAPFSHDAADVLSELRPAVVSFHFGLPAADLLARVKSWGSRVLSSATTVDEALWLEAHGVHAIIAQGVEAGGHRGMFLTEDPTTQVGTFALVPQIVQKVKLPVIAAGGIADARGVAAAMRLGASGVQVGTAYLLCPEATTSAVHRAALRSEAGRHTADHGVHGQACAGYREAPPFPLAATAIAPLRARAESLGLGDFSPLWAGQNTSGCREISAGDLTNGLAAEL